MSTPDSSALRQQSSAGAHVVELAARAANLEAGRQRGLALEDDWDTLTEQERGGWRLLAQAVIAALDDDERMKGDGKTAVNAQLQAPRHIQEGIRDAAAHPETGDSPRSHGSARGTGR